MKSEFYLRRCHSAIELPAQLCGELIAAIEKLEGRLQEKFERLHPGRGHVIQQALAEAEELAWRTSFPHLFLPDFAEVRLTEIFAQRELAYDRRAA